jgi:hypothetical protein
MYPITEKAKDTENNTINNKYDTNLISNPPRKKQKRNTHANSQHQRTKWLTFTYSNKEEELKA